MRRLLALLTAAVAIASLGAAPVPVRAVTPPAFRLEAVPGKMPRVVRLAPSAALRSLSAGTAVVDRPVRVTATPADADWGWVRIGTETAWETATAKGEGVVVAVVDSGVDLTHPALVGALWTNVGEIPGNSIDDDENGYVDDVHGYDFVDGDGEPNDGYGHGTHVAGIIVAADDGADSLGVAPNAELMAVRVIGDDGGGTIADVMDGISWAVDHGADIVNLSLGAEMSQAEMDLLQPAFDAARAAGVLVVAAAGNNGPGDIVGFPAGADNVLGVASSDDDGAGDGPISYYSSRHSGVDVAAPGYGVLSTLPGGAHGLDSGTSMATPHVAGVAALLYAQRAGITPAAVEALIGSSTNRYPLTAVSGGDAVAEQMGDGILSAAGAVAANAGNAGGVSMPEHVIDANSSITVTPLRPSGAAPASCTLSLRQRVHPGVGLSPIVSSVTIATSCAAHSISDADITAAFPDLSGVNGESAELELVAAIDGTTTVRRLLVDRPDTAVGRVAPGSPRLGMGGIITNPLANIATLRSDAPDAFSRFEMRIRTIGTTSWSTTYPVVFDGAVRYAPLTIGTRTINLTSTAGRRLEISGRATDAAGNAGAWSAVTTAVVPQWLNPTVASGSLRMSATTRATALGGSVLVGTKSGSTLPKLMTGPFAGNLFAFTGTYSTSKPVCYTVRVYWSESGTTRSASKSACTNADWADTAGVNDETNQAYTDGQERVLLFRWVLPSRTYGTAEIRATSMPTGSSFEIDAIATKLP